MAEQRLATDGYVFDFAEDACDAYVFDSPEHNGIRNVMAPVDIIAELPNEYLFLELKKYSHEGMKFKCPLWREQRLIDSLCPLANDDKKRTNAVLKRIAASLRKKYCDTFLYLYAEDKLYKPVNYVCVVGDLDSALCPRLQDILQGQLPKGKPIPTWVQSIVKNVAVVNVNGWNSNDKLRRYGECRLEK